MSDDIGFGRNEIILGADMTSSAHVGGKKKDILIIEKGPTDRLDDITLTAEKEYSTNFTEYHKRFCLSLHYNGANSYIFVNGVEIIKFKVKDSEINATPLYLEQGSKDFSVDNMKKTGVLGCIYDFSVDYHAIVVDGISGIHKYLILKNGICLGKNRVK